MKMSSSLVKNLIKWSKKNYADLEWRKERSLYTTLVSEIMLQQTTVGTVRKRYSTFIKKYPTLKKLARENEAGIVKSWEGLGYYRRARNLLKAVQAIDREYTGKFPLNRQELLKIPGIGEYTAAALISIGADQKALAIDANIFRVINRFFDLDLNKTEKNMTKMREMFENDQFFSSKIISYQALNEALMDIGRVFCQANQKECTLCPLNKECQFLKNGRQIQAKSSDTISKEDLKLLRLVIKRNKKILLYQKNATEWLSGQFELPTFIIKSSDKKLSQYPHWNPKNKVEVSFKLKQAITKYKIENQVCVNPKGLSRKLLGDRYQWVLISELKHYHLSSAVKKILNNIELDQSQMT